MEVSPRVNRDMHEALHRNSEEILGPWHKQPSSVQLELQRNRVHVSDIYRERKYTIGTPICARAT